jgi:hypothetical protein
MLLDYVLLFTKKYYVLLNNNTIKVAGNNRNTWIIIVQNLKRTEKVHQACRAPDAPQLGKLV